MVTEKELLEGIAKCIIGEPTPGKMLELASYYIVKDYLFGEPDLIQSYSMSSAQKKQDKITTGGASDFLNAVDGLDASAVMDIMDELMETIKIIQPRIYDGVMRRINDL